VHSCFAGFTCLTNPYVLQPPRTRNGKPVFRENEIQHRLPLKQRYPEYNSSHKTGNIKLVSY